MKVKINKLDFIKLNSSLQPHWGEKKAEKGYNTLKKQNQKQNSELNKKKT